MDSRDLFDLHFTPLNNLHYLTFFYLNKKSQQY